MEVYKGETIIQLYNPWGKTEFKGKYAEDAKSWDDTTLQQLFPKRKICDDGMFFMTVAEFQKIFDQLSVCYVKEHFKIQQTIRITA